MLKISAFDPVASHFAKLLFRPQKHTSPACSCLWPSLLIKHSGIAINARLYAAVFRLIPAVSEGLTLQRYSPSGRVPPKLIKAVVKVLTRIWTLLRQFPLCSAKSRAYSNKAQLGGAFRTGGTKSDGAASGSDVCMGPVSIPSKYARRMIMLAFGLRCGVLCGDRER